MSNSTAPQKPEAEPVDLLGYLKRLGRYWIAGLVAAVIVAGALFGYGASKGTDVVGSTWAKAHVMITMPSPKTEPEAVVQAEAGSRIINSYVALDGNDQLLKTAAGILHDGTTTGTLRQSTNIYWAGGGQIIAVYALGTNDAQAQKRADAYAQAFIKDAPTMLPPAVVGASVPQFTLVQKAQPSTASPSPTAPSSGGLSRTISSPLVAVAAGIVAGIVVMGIAEFVGLRRRRR